MTTQWTDSAQPSIGTMYRLQWEEAQQCHVLLFPEGMIKLNGPVAEILKRCDDKTSVAALVTDLETTFAETDLRADVIEFLEQAHGRHWIR